MHNVKRFFLIITILGAAQSCFGMKELSPQPSDFSGWEIVPETDIVKRITPKDILSLQTGLREKKKSLEKTVSNLLKSKLVHEGEISEKNRFLQETMKQLKFFKTKLDEGFLDTRFFAKETPDAFFLKICLFNIRIQGCPLAKKSAIEIKAKILEELGKSSDAIKKEIEDLKGPIVSEFIALQTNQIMVEMVAIELARLTILDVKKKPSLKESERKKLLPIEADLTIFKNGLKELLTRLIQLPKDQVKQLDAKLESLTLAAEELSLLQKLIRNAEGTIQTIATKTTSGSQAQPKKEIPITISLCNYITLAKESELLNDTLYIYTEPMANPKGQN